MTHLDPPRFEDGRAMLLVGLRRHHGYSAAGGVAGQWREFEQLLPIPGAVGAVTYGAMCGTDPVKQTFEYMCAVEVPDFSAAPRELGRMRVPAQRYAVFTHSGEVEQIRQAWAYIFGTWLPQSGYRTANTPDFERYDERFDAQAGRGDVEIWIGVEPVNPS